VGKFFISRWNEAFDLRIEELGILMIRRYRKLSERSRKVRRFNDLMYDIDNGRFPGLGRTTWYDDDGRRIRNIRKWREERARIEAGLESHEPPEQGSEVVEGQMKWSIATRLGQLIEVSVTDGELSTPSRALRQVIREWIRDGQPIPLWYCEGTIPASLENEHDAFGTVRAAVLELGWTITRFPPDPRET
jgi:hypothetical protein